MNGTMANNKEPMSDEGGNHDQLEEHMHEAMKGLGWVLPRSLDDVAQVEAELDAEGCELPPALRDPFAVLERKRADSPKAHFVPANEDTEECLAQAAREGKTISPEIRQKMQADRERVERKKEP
jgi:hypothetical protein